MIQLENGASFRKKCHGESCLEYHFTSKIVVGGHYVTQKRFSLLELENGASDEKKKEVVQNSILGRYRDSADVKTLTEIDLDV